MAHKLFVSTKAVIFDMKQVTQFPGVTIIPPETPKRAIKIIGQNGREELIPLDAAITSGVKPFGPVWRVRCAEVFNDSTLEVVFDVGQSPGARKETNWSPTLIEAWGSFESGNGNDAPSVPFHVKQLLEGRKIK